MRSCLVTMLLARAALAEPIALSVAAELPCLTEGSLSSKLASAGLEVAETGVLDVDVSASPEGLRLRARRARDARLLVRTVSTRRGCDGVELAVVTLLSAWASGERLEPMATPHGAPDAGFTVTTPAAPTSSRPGPSTPATSTASVNVVVELPALFSIDAGHGDGGAGDGGVLLAVTAAAGPVDAGVLPLAAALAPSEPVFDLRVAVGGGVTAIVDTPVAPSAAIAIDLGVGGFGAALELTLDGDVALDATQASLTVSAQSLGLLARLRLQVGRWALDGALGLRGTRLIISGRAAGITTTVSLFSGGPAAAGTVWLRLIGPLHAMLRAVASLRLPVEHLEVVNGPTFTLGLLQVSAVAGLGVAWP